MSADEETARHVPVRRSEAAAELTGGGGSMSRRRRGGDQHARWRARLFGKWRFDFCWSMKMSDVVRMTAGTGLPFAAPVQSPWLHARCV